MSTAFVPGRIRLEAACSVGNNWDLGSLSEAPRPGDWGAVWSSAIGGGLGKRGKVDGENDGGAEAIERAEGVQW